MTQERKHWLWLWGIDLHSSPLTEELKVVFSYFIWITIQLQNSHLRICLRFFCFSAFLLVSKIWWSCIHKLFLLQSNRLERTKWENNNEEKKNGLVTVCGLRWLFYAVKYGSWWLTLKQPRVLRLTFNFCLRMASHWNSRWGEAGV